jgi:hypothetical protein
MDNAIGYKKFISDSLKKHNAKYANENQIRTQGDTNLYKQGSH